MATASSVSSEKVLTDINEQILLCAICMERFKSPKILPCYHTYCEPCLTEWVKTNNDKLICPTCKELFPLPSGGVSAIDNNRFINDLQQILSNVNPDSDKSTCEVCEKEAKFWCQDCGESFCDDCIQSHKRMRLLKGHKLMTVDEYNEKMSSEHSRLIQPRFCDKHPSAQLELYCDSCQIPTCVKCTLVEHTPPEHKTLSVEAALEKYMPTMKKYEEKASQKVSDLKQARDGVLNVGKCLEKNKTTTESQIRDLSKTMVDEIKKHENRLLTEVADTYSPKRKQIDSKVEQLEHRLVGAESMHSHLNHLLRYGGAVDIMAAQMEISHSQRLEQDGLTEENFDSIDSNLGFTENPRCRLVDLGNVNQEDGSAQDDLLNKEKATSSKEGIEGNSSPQATNVNKDEPIFDRITCVYEEVMTDSLQIPKEMQNSLQVLLNEMNVQYNFKDDLFIIKGDLAKFIEIYNKLTSMMQDSTEAGVSNRRRRSHGHRHSNNTSNPQFSDLLPMLNQPLGVHKEFMELAGIIRLDHLPLPISAVITSLNNSSCRWGMKKCKDKMQLMVKGHLNHLIQVNDDLVAMLGRYQVGSAIAANLSDHRGNKTVEYQDKATQGSPADNESNLSDLHQGRSQNVSKNIGRRVSPNYLHSSDPAKECMENIFAVVNLSQNESERDGMSTLETTSKRFQKTEVFGSGEAKLSIMKDSIINMSGNTRNIDASSQSMKPVNSNEAVAQLPQNDTTEVREQDKHFDHEKHDSVQRRTLTMSLPAYKERENESKTEKTASNVVTVVTELKSTSELPIPRANHDIDSAEEAKGSDNRSNKNHELEVRNSNMTGHDTTKNRKIVNNINQISLRTSTARSDKRSKDKPKASLTAVSDHAFINTDVDSSSDQMPKLSQNNVEERKDFDKSVEGASAEGVVCLDMVHKIIPRHNENAEIRATHEQEKERANQFNDSKQINDRMTENSQSQACNTSLYQDKRNNSPDLPEPGSTSGEKKEGNDEKTEHTVQDSDQKDSGNVSPGTDNQLDSKAKIDRSTKTTKHPVHSTSTDGKLSCASQPVTFQDDQHLLHYAFLVHSQKISDLKVKHRVSIDYKLKNPTKVTIVPKKSCTNEDAQRVGEDFKKFLKCIEKNLKYGIIDFRGKGILSTKKAKAMNIIAQFERDNMIVRVPVAEKNVVKLCSENQEVLDDTVQKINKTLGIVPPKKDSKVGNADVKDNKSAQTMKNIKESDINSNKKSGTAEKAEESSNRSCSDKLSTISDSRNLSSEKDESTDNCETHAIKENQYILQFFYDTYKYEMTELSKRYNVRIKWDPSTDAGTINIIPGDDCLAESVESTKGKLKSYFQTIHRLLEKEVVDFSNNPDITEKTLQEAQGMLELYKNDVSFLLTSKGKFILFSNDKQLLQKAKNEVVSSLGLLSQKSHSAGSSGDKEHSQTQLKEPVSDSPKCATDEATKKATVGEYLLAFIFHVYRERLSSIEKNNHVKFEWNVGHDVVIKSAKDKGLCSERNLENAYEVFVSFVQSLHIKMISKEIDLKGKVLSPSKISQAVKMTQAIHDKIHVIESDEQIRILGETSQVKCAKETFCNHLGVNIPQARHGGWKTGGSSGIQRNNSSDNQRRKVLLEFEVGKVRKTKVLVCQGDITKERVDAIANAANERLDQGAGVTGVIIKAGGYSIQKESNDIIQIMGRHLNISEVVNTRGGTLPCKWVLHVVSPRWDVRNTGKVTEALHNCCKNLLSRAESLGAKSVAIPAIGTGIYGVPNHICAKMMYHSIITYFGSQLYKGKVDEIHFIDIDKNTVKAFTKVFQEELNRDGSLYSKPEDFGGDTEILGCRTTVDGPLYGRKGTGLNQPDIEQLTEGQEMHRGKSDSTSQGRSNIHGAIPKLSSRTSGTDDKTDRSTWGKDLKGNTFSICLDDIEEPKELPCKHVFCKACIDQSEKIRGPTCPVCKQISGLPIGDMPEGKMTHRVGRVLSLPGFPKCGSIIITYDFPSGYQKEEHPNPGKWYTGTFRTAYLPNNAEGQEVFKLLKIAFDRRLTFTIGRSVTSGLTDIVTWNGIHHKTSIYGGPTGFGYPDPDYLKRVKEELAAKGVK